MDDRKIIDLFFERDEKAISEIEKKYGGLCRSVASNILAMREDVEERLNDVFLALWNSIPPERPDDLKAYVARSVRNRAHVITREANAWKRGEKFRSSATSF